jgi:hypothetical protein
MGEDDLCPWLGWMFKDIRKEKSAMNVRCSTRISGLAAALLLASVVHPAWAHHSAAQFNLKKQISVHGTVEKWVWGNPHSWLFVLVVKPNGSQQVWAFEGGSTGLLANRGWHAEDMKRGDQVTVTAAPVRDGNRVGLLKKVKLANGRVLDAGIGTLPGGAAKAALPPR